MPYLTLEAVESVIKKCLEPIERKLSELEATIVRLGEEKEAKQSDPKQNTTAAITPRLPQNTAAQKKPITKEITRRVSTSGRVGATGPITARAETRNKLAPNQSAAPAGHNETTPTTLATALPAQNEIKEVTIDIVQIPPHETLIPGDLEVKTNDDSNWQVVPKRGRRRRNTRTNVICGTGVDDPYLQTVERAKKIHACFLRPEVTAESMLAYMEKKKQSGKYRVEKLELKHTHYASFAIFVPTSLFDFFMTPANWPPGTEITEWFRPSTRRAARSSPDSSSTGRAARGARDSGHGAASRARGTGADTRGGPSSSAPPTSAENHQHSK